MDGQYTEEEISMLLDTYMYLGYQETSKEPVKLKQVVERLSDVPAYGAGGDYENEYQILKQAVQDEQIGNLKVCYASGSLGFDKGTKACTFLDEENDRIFIAYRGTGDGEWPDNGLGMTQEVTVQQQRAVDYFDTVVRKAQIRESQRVIVTGHSKGGNKAQFVTMETEFGDLVDRCYSVDGQGMSEKADARFRRKYSEEEYRNRIGKLYGIHGENDYVSPLGRQIIPEDHITYIKTPVAKGNMAGYHDITYMFATLTVDGATGALVTRFSGRRNEETLKRGTLGNYAAALSNEIMQLPEEERAGAAGVVMQGIEAAGGEKKGLNGEKTTFDDFKKFLSAGIPAIVQATTKTTGGLRFLGSTVWKDSYAEEIPDGVFMEVDYRMLAVKGEDLIQTGNEVIKIGEWIRTCQNEMPFYMRGNTIVALQLNQIAAEMESLGEKLQKLAAMQKQAAECYQKADRKTEELCHI